MNIMQQEFDMIEEIKTDYSYDGFIYVDVYFKGLEEGKNVALIEEPTGEVIFTEKEYIHCRRVMEEMKPIIDDIQIRNERVKAVIGKIVGEITNKAIEMFVREVLFKHSKINCSNAETAIIKHFPEKT